jgi:hypothetical protein
MRETEQEIARAEHALDQAKELLSPAEVGRMVGFSATFIRLEIHAGAIQAVKGGRGATRKRWRIPRDEAKRYQRQMLGSHP